MLTGEELWKKVQQALQQNLSKPTFETWIRPARCSGFQNGVLALLAPNGFSSDWLRKNYVQTIEEVAGNIYGQVIKVTVKVKDEGKPSEPLVPKSRYATDYRHHFSCCTL